MGTEARRPRQPPRVARAGRCLCRPEGRRAKTPAATGFYDDSVRQLNGALDARRDRLQASRGGLPFEMAALILFSSIVIVGYAVLVGSPNFWFHVLGPAAIAVVVVFSLVVLVDLSYPLSRAVAL